MALEVFEVVSFRRKTLARIEQANVILTEMRDAGYTLTVRQLYYQFVARGLLDNKQSNYKMLAETVDNARKAGLIDWEAIEDRTRYLRSWRTHASPTDAVRSAAYGYMENLWADQTAYCEVWVEKDALLGVIERPCGDYRVPYFACRGYASSSELYEAGKRLRRKLNEGHEVTVFHLGDHDPSGINMTDVNRSSLAQFGRMGGRFRLERLALNMDQVREYDPPPNPLKENDDGTLSDSRGASYSSLYGDSSWELDALEPQVLDQIVRDAIEDVVDADKFQAARDRESENEKTIMAMADNFADVGRYLKHRHDNFRPYDYGHDMTVDEVLEEVAGEPGEDEE